ncbi:MAG TPA: GH92 family glycosyl hydrolase [Candidatus Xenobia bacterium]|jgi:predicted alpha-1,2-mannosidase
MRKIVFLASCLLAFTGVAFADPVDDVNPLVGSDNTAAVSHGNTYPAAAWPFGMIEWTPQTAGGPGLYQYRSNQIIGFRGTHKPSLWMDDYGCFSLMPVAGALSRQTVRSSHFSHDQESAHPYEYQCHLDDSNVDATVVPTQHGALMEFAWAPGNGTGSVLLDAQGGSSTVEVHPEAREIVGYNAGSQIGPDYRCYFVMQFDTPMAAWGTWQPVGIYDGSLHREGDHVGAFMRCWGLTVRVRMATSFISVEQARKNLAAEVPDFDVAAAAVRARSAWNQALSRVDLEGGTPAWRRTFYTAMYRTLLLPHMLAEPGPQGPAYRSPYDLKVHDGWMIANCGFWDTYRTEIPWLCIMYPQQASHLCQGLLNAYQQGGWLPKWPNPNETNVMIGSHSDAVLAEALALHVPGIDVVKAFQAAWKDATTQGDLASGAREGLEYYQSLGYLPTDRMVEATSRTLEYAYDDYCVGQIARAAGHDAEYRMLSARARNYRNVFDPQSAFMRGRNKDGSWQSPFDPLAWGSPFTEGCAWHYLFSAQQDVAGLMALMGGPAPFAARLDALFSTPPEYHVGAYHRVIHEMRELGLVHMGQYAHNNEPVQHDIYLFDYAGQPWKTQYWAHRAVTELYSDRPDGILGDEDTGQMSAWYVMSALGFYPVCPGQPIYAVGSPLFSRAVLHLPNSKDFTVSTAGSGPYIQSATLDGTPWTHPWFSQDDLSKGGELHLVMGPRPNRDWGNAPEDAPPSAL